MHEKMDTVLSICIPVYNGGDGLFDNISQILLCDSDKFEIVVNDNCSNDGCIDRIRKIEDSRLKICQNKNEVLPTQNWYTALKNGKGKYIMLLRDNDRIYVDNLLSFIAFLENSNYIVIKNGNDWIRPYNGEISIMEYFYYAWRLSHISFFACLKEAFDAISFEEDYTGYPQFAWEMQMLSKYDIESKQCYINSKIPVVYASKEQKASRTKKLTLFYVERGKPINYTYEDVIYLDNFFLKYLLEIYKEKKQVLKVDYFVYCAGITRATFLYYDHMHDKTHRYGVPYVYYSKKQWLGKGKMYYRDKLLQLQVLGRVPVRYKFLMRLVVVYNTILFRTSYYVKKEFYNPFYIANLVNIRLLRGTIKYLEKIILNY